MKRQATDGEKTIAKHISDEGLTYTVYIKKFYKFLRAGIWKRWADAAAAACGRRPGPVKWLQTGSHRKDKPDSRL